MAQTKLLILENRLGQKVRTFAVGSEAFNLVYLTDSRRIEGVTNLKTLEDSNVDYRLLHKIELKKITQEGLQLEDGLGRIRLVSEDQAIIQSPTYALPEEHDEEKLKVLLKKTSIAHVAAVFLMMAAGYVWTAYFKKDQEPTLVTIVVPKKDVPPPIKKASRPHVAVSEKKIKPTKKTVKAVAKRVVKPKKVAVKQTHKSMAKARNVNRLGALAALGGTPQGTKGYEGLSNSSLKAIRSAGVSSDGGGVGSSGRGGMKGYLPGNGLVAGTAGQGSRAQGAGGYGTRGAAGGKAGYGKISLVGGTNAISLPLDDEAEVQGGLDRDQIIAVINRNKGQIIYCYEKGLQAQPSIGGRVSVDFVIGPSGRITTAKVAQSSLGSKMVENCMLARMKTWQFPRPVGNVNVDVLYPFELTRVSAR